MSILPRSTPEAQGIASAAVADFVATAEKTIRHLHSFMLLRHGTVIAEGWWRPYREEAPHMLFSLSKSFTSTAIGLAVDEGRLSLDDPVIKYFPDALPKKVSKNLAAMRVRHLLSMSTGHDQDSTERAMRAKKPFKAFLSFPVTHTPGTRFVYDSAASYMLAAIVQKLTGQTLLEYLTPRIFEPLGIAGATWESHPNGINFGGWGLSIKTEDIARFGQLYLQKGQWNGRQLISAAWIAEATSKQVANGDKPESDWAQGYGYQFWRCRYNAYRADGAFGQYCIVMPEQDVVLAITSGVPDMQAVLDVTWGKLLPAMAAGTLPPDPAGNEALSRTLQSLKLSPPKGAPTSPSAARVSGKTFTFEPNEERLQSLCFDFQANTLTDHLLGGGRRRGKHNLVFGIDRWMEGLSALGAPAPGKVAASGTWTSDDIFTLTLCYYETPFTLTITCRFEGEQVFLCVQPNVAFGPRERPTLTGKINSVRP
ncbi:MAG: serine hydrolase domain-containing protein [Chloroflexota bacterium]